MAKIGVAPLDALMTGKFLLTIFFYLCFMRPDFPQKTFSDKRSDFNFLMEALAMDGN